MHKLVLLFKLTIIIGCAQKSIILLIAHTTIYDEERMGMTNIQLNPEIRELNETN